MSGPCIVSESEFRSNWDQFTNGILNGLNWSHVFCAGGAVLATLVKNNEYYQKSDIDLFIHSVHSDEEANQVFKHICKVVSANTSTKCTVIRTFRAITILNHYPNRLVQIICRQYRSPGQVLLGFDLDSCAVGYNGKDVYAMDRFRRAITKRYNLVNKSRRSLNYESRLFKYAQRGFAVLVPNARVDDIDYDAIYNRQYKKGLSCLGKLAWYHMKLSSNDPHKTPQFESDYTGDFDIPWGPTMSPEQVVKILNIKDKKRFFSMLAQYKKNMHTGTANKPVRTIETIHFDGDTPIQEIVWIKDNLAYQDLDNNNRRLMVGSFHLPPIDERWDDNVYKMTKSSESTTAKSPERSSLVLAESRSVFAQKGVVTSIPKPVTTVPPVTSESRNLVKKKVVSTKTPIPVTTQQKPEVKSPVPPSSKTIDYTGIYRPKNAFSAPSQPNTLSGQLNRMSIHGQPVSSTSHPSGSNTTPQLNPSLKPQRNMVPQGNIVPPGNMVPSGNMVPQGNIVSRNVGTKVTRPSHLKAPSMIGLQIPSQPKVSHQPTMSPPTTSTLQQGSTLQRPLSHHVQPSSFMHPKSSVAQPSTTTLKASKYGPGKIPLSMYTVNSNRNEQPHMEQSLVPQVQTHVQPQVQPKVQPVVTTVSNVKRKVKVATNVSNVAKPHTLESVVPDQETLTQLLLIANVGYKNTSITLQQRGEMKDLILSNDIYILSAYKVFQTDNDMENFFDTIKRILK